MYIVYLVSGVIENVMGCALSDLEDPESYFRNQEIDEELRRSYNAERNVLTILLLGTGDSGKSTILKQMKIIHGIGFTKEELVAAVPNIQLTIFEPMGTTLRDKLLWTRDSSSWPDADNIEEALRILKSGSSTILNDMHYKSFNVLYDDPKIRNEFCFTDSSSYFISNRHRIFNLDYVPTQEDYLKVRIRTTGINESLFQIKHQVAKGHQATMRFKMIDVGGQRSERRKWIHCFEGVNAVLFVSSLSEYDDVLAEDETKNRMKESLELFQSIAQNVFFKNSGFILFLNKDDLFEAKVHKISIKVCFSEYGGEDEKESARNYILNQFLNQTKRKIYYHFTRATDTSQIRYIFSDVVNMIISSTLEKHKLL